MSHPPLHDPNRYPRPQLRLYLAEGVWIGPGKADLLELIDETGSISEAGRRMGMSYKRAWSLVDGLNRMFARPLVTSERGGTGGGGAQLTETGQEVLTRFRHIETALRSAIQTDMAVLVDLRGSDPAG